MTKEDGEKYTLDFSKLMKDKEELLVDLSKLGIKNIDHWRYFTSTLLTIDVAALAGAFAILSATGSTHIHFALFLGGGIAFLIFDAVFIVWYTTSILIQENRALTERREFLEGSFDEVSKLSLDSLQSGETFETYMKKKLDKMKDLSERETLITKGLRKEKGSIYLNLISWCFIIGLLLIGVSLIPIDISGIVHPCRTMNS